MIDSLYDCFKKWSAAGSVFLISDTHFEDSDCKLMDANWISPQEHIDIIKSKVHKNDTLIHLGDVGRPHWLEQIKGYKILIQGNHDRIGELKPYFNEIYTGPLMIAQKIILSHEPIPNVNWCLNIHGHNHNGVSYDNENPYYLNIASNVVKYKIINLKTIIKDGYLSKITDIHRQTIDKAKGEKAIENSGWVPTNERLPKAGEYVGDVAKYYLVQNVYGDMMVAKFTHSEYWEQIYQLKPIGDEIVAWRELPPLYKPESEDNKYMEVNADADSN